MDGPIRRRLTLSHQISTMDSCNLRELLKLDEDEVLAHRHHGGAPRRETVTLAAVLACEKRELSSSSSVAASRTLLDVIRDEDDPQRLLVRSGDNRGSWRSFKDLIRLRRAGAAWPAPSGSVSTIRISHPSTVLASGTPIVEESGGVAAESGDVVAAEGNRSTGGSDEQQPEEEEPIRISLMALLEQTDRMGSNEGNLRGTSGIATAMMGMVDPQEEEEEATTVSGIRDTMYVCCVCMVRHKGAAFIPCGHTFCRLCSRELWVSRGNCPLCNGYILEILDIF